LTQKTQTNESNEGDGLKIVVRIGAIAFGMTTRKKRFQNILKIFAKCKSNAYLCKPFEKKGIQRSENKSRSPASNSWFEEKFFEMMRQNKHTR